MRGTVAGLALVASTGACVQGPFDGVGRHEEAIRVCPPEYLEGIDVYDGQGAIDWAQVAASGRSFAFMKATQGDYNEQSTFADNWAGAKANGVYRSAYHYFDPTVDGVTQANWFLDHMGPLEPGDLPPTLDLECPTSSDPAAASPNCEYTGNSGWVDPATLNARIHDWLDTVEAAVGRRPIVYSYNYWFGDAGCDDSALVDYPFYIAALDGACYSVGINNVFTSADFYQYSWTGRVPGIATDTDLDRFAGTIDDLAAFAGGVADYHGTLVAVTAPETMYAGDRTPVVVEILNDGSATWDGRVSLRAEGDLTDVSWDEVDRPASVAGAVAPGETARFDFLVQAPAVDEETDAHDTLGLVLDGRSAFPPSDVALDVRVLPASDAIVDDDGDGFARAEDCDDSDPAVHPRAADPCDDVDSDCDGVDCAEEAGAKDGGCSCGVAGRGGGAARAASIGLLLAILAIARRRRLSTLLAVVVGGCSGDDAHRGPDGAVAADAGGCSADRLEACNGVDDDCDGATDEGCEWYFGRPSALVGLHALSASDGSAESPRLTADGRTLFYAAYLPGEPGEKLLRADRESPAEPFGAPVVVPTEIPPGLVCASNSVSDDESELFVEAHVDGAVDWDIHRATRAEAGSAYVGFERLDVSAPGTDDLHPYLAAGGRDLYFTSNREGTFGIYRARRTGAGEPFGAPERLTVPGSEGADLYTPTLSEDGLTVFFTEERDGVERFERADRAAVDDLVLGDPVELADLGTSGVYLSVSEPTREAFFTSNRAWSPVEWGVWRAEVCRDGPCFEAQIDCPSRVRSPDRSHCYQAFPEALEWNAAESACELLAPPGGTGHLATIHSAEEQELAVALAAGGTVWIGASDAAAEGTWAWVTGEPVLKTFWSPAEPNDYGGAEDYAVLDWTGTWNDIGGAFPYLCETEIYPTW